MPDIKPCATETNLKCNEGKPTRDENWHIDYEESV